MSEVRHSSESCACVVTTARLAREDPVARGVRMVTLGVVLAIVAWLPLVGGLAIDHELWFVGLIPGSYSAHAVAHALRGRKMIRRHVSRRSRR